jgi:inosine-uridine nucleoside N-ribohydrolase
MPIKVLLDTDIDIVGDIDDAMCLAYLLAQPACELLGITTVSWETGKRAMVASALCKAAGRDVPIYPGAATPLLVPLPSVESQQPYDVEGAILARWEHNELFPRGQAVEFMRQTIRRHPGEVVLLAIGPLTNIALLFATDPEIPQLLKGLVMMAGLFAEREPGADLREWNARLDPQASAIVYRAPVSSHRSVGLDVTRQVRMEAAELRRRLGDRPPQPLGEMVEAWLAKAPGVTFHDPLAAATLFDERICRFKRGLVEVELTSERLQGLTYWTPGGTRAPHQVALGVDRERFFEHYFSNVAPIH